MNTLSNSIRSALCCVVLATPLWAQSANPATGNTYQVVAGDTLDKVIHKTLPDSPLRAEILRNAFIQQNPQAFTKSAPRGLVVGAMLHVPNHDDLLRSFMVPGVTPGNSGALRGNGYASADMAMQERKKWVHFP